jgi:isopentenyldiphosphate isomerase
MMELIYPYELAPVLPAPKADNSVTFKPGTEFFPVIEPNGLVIARSPREYCHSGAKPLHPVVHLHIIDRYSRIYLQKRPLTKFIQPGKWDTAVGGHVAYGEMLLEALFRESHEELGFTEYNPIHLLTYEFESEVEKERISVYAAVGNFELNPDPEELDGGKWWELDEIEANLGKGVFTPNFESEFAMIRQSLLALL